MSDHSIILVPKAAFALPSLGEETAAQDLASQLFPDCEAIESHRTEALGLIYAIESRGTPVCPSCGTDLDAWWWDELEGWLNAERESDLVQALPCCQQRCSPNDLNWVDGSCEMLARFQLEIVNANSGELTDQQLQAFEQVLGCQVRVVYRWL